MTGPRRILFMDHAETVGGAQLALVQHLRALDRERFEPVVACTDRVPALVARYRETGTEVHVLAMPRLRRFHPAVPLRLLRAASAIRALVGQLGVELVIANTSRAAYLAVPALAGSGIPLVWWTRDFLFNRLVFRAFRRRASRIFCVSEAIRRYYGGTRDPRFEVLYVGSGIEAELRELPPDAVAAERARWGYVESDIVVGFMGRLVSEKGAGDVIDAVASLQARDRRVKVLIVGSGRGQPNDVEDELRELVKGRGWSFVTFAGFQREEATYYRLFDIFVLATRDAEPYATSVVQAMFARTPVIATATGGTPELVVDRDTGLLVPPSNPAAIAGAIEALIDDESLRERLIQRAHAVVVRGNREEHTTALAERSYAELLRSPSV